MTIDDLEKAFLDFQDANFSAEDWRKATGALKPLSQAAKAEQARVIREAKSWSELGRSAQLNKQVQAEARKLAGTAGRALGRHVSVTELFELV